MIWAPAAPQLDTIALLPGSNRSGLTDGEED
jgi:hypothetical protein